MIRPITCFCFLLACGSGLYLYQTKHQAQLLDQQIGKTIRETDAVRERTRTLHAEWTLLNDPSRLQKLADQFFKLKTLQPGQFTNLAELDARLPAVPPPPPPATTAPAPAPPPEMPEPPAALAVPIAQAAPGTRPTPEEPKRLAATPAPERLAVTPVAMKVAAAIPPLATRPAEHKATAPRPATPPFGPFAASTPAPRPAAPEPRQTTEARLLASASEPRPVRASAEARAASLSHAVDSRPAPIALAAATVPHAPAPRPATLPAVMASAAAPLPAVSATPSGAPSGGSLLGMARTSSLPAPQPVSASQWVNSR